jgi:hypothetical protein
MAVQAVQQAQGPAVIAAAPAGGCSRVKEKIQAAWGRASNWIGDTHIGRTWKSGLLGKIVVVVLVVGMTLFIKELAVLGSFTMIGKGIVIAAKAVGSFFASKKVINLGGGAAVGLALAYVWRKGKPAEEVQQPIRAQDPVQEIGEQRALAEEGMARANAAIAGVQVTAVSNLLDRLA